MIFDINFKKDNLIEKIYIESINELNKFFGFNWKYNKPIIFLVKNRKSFDKLRGEKTEDWLIGESRERDIFILDRKNFEKESCHKYSDKIYSGLIKHEICHPFFRILSGKKDYPLWLNEGIAVYLSKQIEEKICPKKFSNFLEFYNKINKKMYDESGFVVAILIKKFGKQKLLELIKSLKNVDSEKDFEKEFKKIYKFRLNYKEINKLIL